MIYIIAYSIIYIIYLYHVEEKFVSWGCSHYLAALPSPAFPLVGAKVAEKVSWSSVPGEKRPSGRVPGGKSSPRRDRFGCQSPDECPGSQGLASCLAPELLRNRLQAPQSIGSLWPCLGGDTRDRWDNELITQPSQNLRSPGFMSQVEVELKEKQGFCRRNPGVMETLRVSVFSSFFFFNGQSQTGFKVDASWVSLLGAGIKLVMNFLHFHS